MKILPFPVKKNKFGERVVDISAKKYYRQIAEEVLEAHKASIIADIKKVMSDEGCGQCAEYAGEDNEAEELVDIITCCVTRLEITCLDADYASDFDEYVREIFSYAERYYCIHLDFYTELAAAVANAYHVARMNYLMNITPLNFGEYLDGSDLDETNALGGIIVLCLDRLETLGYDEEKRQELYQAVNRKNLKRGYLVSK